MDVQIGQSGSVIGIRPVSKAGEDFFAEYLPLDGDPDASWLNGTLWVESNYIENILDGMREEGLTFV